MKREYIAPVILKVDLDTDPLMEVVSLPVDDGGSEGEDEVGGGDVLAPQGSVWEE
jgi:hypothetical protein